MANATEESAVDTGPVGAEIEDERRARAFAGEPPFAVHPSGRGRVAAAVKDAVIAGFVALAMSGPMIGLRTETAVGGLSLSGHWGLVAIAVAVVFGGRLILNLFVWDRATAIKAVTATAFRRLPSGTQMTEWKWPAFVVAIAFTLVMPFLPFANRYWMDQAIVVLTYCMLGWGLNVVVGLAGLLDLGYVAFYAVGAYSFGLLATNFDLGFWVCLPMAGMLAAGWGLILGFPVLRLRGDYLAIVTLAFGEMVRIVIVNWYSLTNGPDGISGIPRPTLFGIPFERGEGGFAAIFGLEYSPLQRIVYLYYIILILALVTNFITLRLRRLPVGRAWEALREDEIACRSLGINTTNTKLTAFAVGAMFGGFAGSFFATRQGFISPESFTAIESFIILAVVVLGGLGSQLGIVIAVIFLNTAFEALRELQEYRMLIVGMAMVLIMVWRPRGLISTRQPSIALKGRAKTVRAELVGEGRG
jgi:branched-chain amino acid transport system permease protein